MDKNTRESVIVPDILGGIEIDYDPATIGPEFIEIFIEELRRSLRGQ